MVDLFVDRRIHNEGKDTNKKTHTRTSRPAIFRKYGSIKMAKQRMQNPFFCGSAWSGRENG